ncbi:MAG: hypothetical protein LBF92_07700 [Synergistaceae bacterium]|nr:hypothetical protein [Synergistaceae bacterium]
MKKPIKSVPPLPLVFLPVLFLALLAFCLDGRVAAQAVGSPDVWGFQEVSSELASPDVSPETQKAPLFQGNDGDTVSVYVLAVCDDLALEAAIRVIAQDKLRSIGHVAVVESMEESSVLLSFSAYRVRAGERDHIVYSFAYGTPDTEFVDGTPVSLPMYISHEAAITRPDELASSISASIAAADANFIRRLLQGGVIRPNL